MKDLDLKKLSGKQWYHQRFDGCPMFLFAVGEAETKIEKRKPAGTEADIRVCFFGGGKADWYLDMKDVKRGADAIIRLAKKDNNISKKLLKAWSNDEKKFDKFFYQQFPKIKLSKLSDNQFVKFWNDYYQLFSKRFTSSSIIDHFALGTDELIRDMLKKELESPVNVKAQGSLRFNEVFAQVTAPVHQSFVNQAEIDLLKIILKQSKESLSSYQKRYFWLKNNYYSSHILSLDYFKKEIESWKNGKKDLGQELQRVRGIPLLNKQTKKILFQKFELSKLLRTLITISEDFTYWQDERKKSTYLNIYIGSKILEEICRRTGFALDELKYAVAPEIGSIIRKQFPSRKELATRSRNSVFVMSREGYIVKTGNEAEKLREIITPKGRQQILSDFRGLAASTGKASGPVKIIMSATEINKVKAGDILVAVMTRPDYIMGMKKAAAIVTNEGGITSHAAIVSRELGIPCIIGTKIATKVLKDGDLVEVNANHGWVRKIK